MQAQQKRHLHSLGPVRHVRACRGAALAKVSASSLQYRYTDRTDELLKEASSSGRSASDGLRVAGELGVERSVAPTVGLFWQLGLQRRALRRTVCSAPLLEFQQPYECARSRVGCIASELGLSQQEVGKLLNKRPQLLWLHAERSLPQRVSFLLSNGVPAHKLSTLAQRSPQVLELAVEHTLQPRVEFLKGLGITAEAVGKMIARDPSLLAVRVDSCQQRVDYLSSEGFSHEEIAKLVTRHPSVLRYTVSALRERLDFLHASGMSAEHVVKTASTFAGIFSLSVEKSLKPKLEYLTTELDRDVEAIANFPTYLSFSLDGRIRPRHLYALSYGGADVATDPMPLDLFRCTDRDFVQRVMPSGARDVDAELERYLQFRQSFLSVHDGVEPVHKHSSKSERADDPGASDANPAEELPQRRGMQNGNASKQASIKGAAERPSTLRRQRASQQGKEAAGAAQSPEKREQKKKRVF